MTVQKSSQLSFQDALNPPQAAGQRPLSILRRKEVEAYTGLSRSTIYDRVRAGTFPAPIQLGPQSVGWIETEIEEFLRNCIRKSRALP